MGRRVALAGYMLLLVGAAWLRLYSAYRVRHPWVITDWLIHYAGGFVRRGLWGEGVLWLAQRVGLSPGAMAALSIAAVYTLFLYFTYRALTRQPTLADLYLFLTAPFLFWFPVLDWQGAYRKEILLFALHAWLVQGIARHPQQRLGRTLLALAVLPALLLSHEALMAWAPFLLVPLVRWGPGWTQWSRAVRLGFLALALLNLGAWGLALIHRGTDAHERAILASLARAGYEPGHPDHAIAWLDVPLAYQLETQTRRWRQLRVAWRMAVFPALVAVAALPAWPRIRAVYGRPGPLALVLLSAGMSFGLMWVAKDWGRFAHAWAMMAFLTLLSRPGRYPLRCQPRSLWGLYALFGLGYGLLWRWHHVHGAQFLGWRAWTAAFHFYRSVLRDLGL